MNFSQKLLSRCKLLEGVDRRVAEAWASNINAVYAQYGKNDLMLLQGEPVDQVGILCSGRAVGERLGRDGSASAVSELREGDLFGDILSGADVVSPVSVRAESRVEAVYVQLEELLRPRPGFEEVCAAVALRLVGEISNKYFEQNRRIAMLTASRLRGKAARYLLGFSGGRSSFKLPHSREAMARYLGCDRSALSRELSRLAAEGIIAFSGREFRLLRPEQLEELAG